MAERRVVEVDVNLAQLASPVVDILEQRAVQRAQKWQAKVRCTEFNGCRAQRAELQFCLLQPLRFADLQRFFSTLMSCQ